MNQSSKPSLTEIDQLIEFLPILYAEGYKPIKEWHGGVRNKDGVMQLPYPDYDEAGIKFCRAASQDCWINYQHKPQDSGQFLRDEKAVASASLDEIKTLLTYFVRRKSYCDETNQFHLRHESWGY